MFLQISTLVLAQNSLFFINRIIFVIANIFFLLAGERSLEKREKINVSNYFRLLGAINIIWIVTELSLVSFISLLSPSSLEEYYAYMLFLVLLPMFLIQTLTFGIFFLLVARKNEANYGRLLFFAAICSLVYTVLTFIVSFLLYSSLSLGMSLNGSILIIMGIINIIAIVFLVAFNVFFMYYSFKIDELYLKIPAILLTIHTAIIILNVIINII